MTTAVEAPTLQELVEQAESNYRDDIDNAVGYVIDRIPKSLTHDYLTDCLWRLLALRKVRGSATELPQEADEAPRAPIAPTPSARGGGRRPGRDEKAVIREGHASAKIALASRAWTDLLATQIALPETNTKVAVRDLTADQLTTLADQLYDTHERLHLLAEHVRLNGVSCARELSPAALAAVIGEAAA